MITFMDLGEKSIEVERCLDSQLWQVCAGGMVQMPPVNSRVLYFPQGHAEHAVKPLDFLNFPRIPASVLCKVSAIKFMTDSVTDEVYAKIRLVPVSYNEIDNDNGVLGVNGCLGIDKPASFAKTLTQSDANNGGGFSVPRYCAETIFPGLDYSANPPVQTIVAKDVHGKIWKFRHIYRGTPRRHLLTTGWSNFVNQKELVAGDSIVFLRGENGDIFVGIRRTKRGIGGRVSALLREEDKLLRYGNGNGKGRVRAESVIEAATLAANGEAFEVVYYPRAGTPEFCVKASLVKSSLQICWGSGMRFKMPFETEDSSRISWFMGTISSVQAVDPMRWPESPWRILQVTWDEPDLLRNVKYVSPWLVELVSNMPTILLPPFSSPRKKLRLPQHQDFALENQLPMPTFSGNLLGLGSPSSCLTKNTPAGMQGARHAHYGLYHLDLQLNKVQSGIFPAAFPLIGHAATPTRVSSSPINQKPSMSENDSGLLTMAHSAQSSKKPADAKKPHFVLFGRPILTEQQISLCCSEDTISPVTTGNSSSENNPDKMANLSDGSGSALHPHSRQRSSSCGSFKLCKDDCQDIDPKLEDASHTLDLSLLRSCDDLYRKLTDIFGIDNFETLNNVLYREI